MTITYKTKAKKFNNDLRHYLSTETDTYEFYKDQKQGVSIVMVIELYSHKSEDEMVQEILKMRLDNSELRIWRGN